MGHYLVTGGAGFIGSNLVSALVERGESVRVLDDFSTGRRENLDPVRECVELVEGDLRERPTVDRAVEGVRCVLHLGALPSVPGSIADPLSTHAVNATGTLNLLIAAEQAGVQRFVFSSSCAVYGDSPVLPKVETMVPAPKSPYAASKLAGEHYCRSFTEIFDLEAVSLRYFNVFGPRQDPRSQYAAVIPNFVTAMLRGQPPVIYGDGRQSRDFVYVANVVQANLLAASTAEIGGRVFNIATGQRHTLLDLVYAINSILGTDLNPTEAPPRPGDVRHSLADITAAGETLGYRPGVSFREGLRRTVAWYRERLQRK
jgi:nucleoside-diphosphate-sugar epimerase